MYRCDRSGLPRQAAQATSTNNVAVLRAIVIVGLLSEFFSCRDWHKDVGGGQPVSTLKRRCFGIDLTE